MLRAYGRLAAFLLVALGAALLMPSLVFGHADYDRSAPNANEVVAAPPAQVDVFFTQEVVRQQGANYVRVFDDQGTQVSDGDGLVNDDNRALISATIPATLPEGRYIVEWKTLSDGDGDEDSAAFCFYVVVRPTPEQAAECAELEAGEPEPTAVATSAGETPTAAEATDVAEGSPTPADGPEDDDDSSNTGVIVGIVIAAVVAVVVIGGGVAFYMRQRQQG